MGITLDEIKISDLDRVERLKIINSIAGIRSVNLIATKSKQGISNLSVFSSVTHLGSNPPLMGFISRPNEEVRRDTISNLSEYPFFTINSVEKETINNAHLTSGKYDSNVSEFEKCGFKESYIGDFSIPFVLSSRVKIGLELVELINIKANNTILVVGKIKILQLPKDYMQKSKDKHIGVVGLNTYYSIDRIGEFDYVRV